LKYREYLRTGVIKKKTKEEGDARSSAVLLAGSNSIGSAVGSVGEHTAGQSSGSNCEHTQFSTTASSGCEQQEAESGTNSTSKCSASKYASSSRLSAAETFANYALKPCTGLDANVSDPIAPDNLSVGNEIFSFKNKKKPHSKGAGAKGGTRVAGLP